MPFSDEGDSRVAVRASYGGGPRGARRTARTQTASGAAAGPQLFYVADAGARGRPQAECCRRSNNPSHQLRKVSLSADVAMNDRDLFIDYVSAAGGGA